ncbi:type II secretion system protein GspG [Pseudoalteromonas shioyasakiensis]|uniref:type II secretion system major pseudopilin GspG n=1 Tax=Pseudoalteromonas shioyasakiensis TaxID=1190813 RepID=UPI0020954655|nr:type II secretion system major pseudopilin GspG [Pseudoalteromonas shioyasakiensis]MCO6356663.1 type II secretion system protein GspG [Pseudoalteromonas shioyasakiensis]
MKHSKNIGFTLIELLIVMVILGLLASIVAPRMFSQVSTAKEKVAKAQMQVLATSLDAYRLDVGDYPSELESLRKSDASNWNGPYFPKEIPQDPWNNSYFYQPQVNESTGEGFTLKSLGKDGKQGGEGEDADVEF